MLPTWSEDAVAGQESRSDKNGNEQSAFQKPVELALLYAVHTSFLDGECMHCGFHPGESSNYRKSIELQVLEGF